MGLIKIGRAAPVIMGVKIMSEIFMVGDVYCNRFGKYKVLAIENSTMTVEYLDGKKTGEQQSLDMKGQGKVYCNMMREMTRLFPVARLSYFRTLGYLVSHGRFEAEVPRSSQASFELRYKTETGQIAIPDHDNYFLLHTESDKWSAELRIYFPSPRAGVDSLDFGDEVTVVSSTRADECRINNNTFWWRLMAVGFRLGNKQDVQRIRNSIPTNYQPEFDIGVAM